MVSGTGIRRDHESVNFRERKPPCCCYKPSIMQYVRISASSISAAVRSAPSGVFVIHPMYRSDAGQNNASTDHPYFSLLKVMPTSQQRQNACKESPFRSSRNKMQVLCTGE
ncbi:hypothetical protein PV05_06011 [Exophiala xenobiotica]|uniref:Uncharacterized protein n=1 Tax=Exophiala xenobiotica TaxID=348802 RepID=A0A0D2EPM2_9EURO|nr:uncharacterized protein PV05_06011 [Exophiala xenobiotica]KIW57463.1 hypothetical protein PV05_06011 [Exophiala xenobiotica]